MSSSAVVVIAALDLRRRPDHRSELRSQLLLGESVTVLSTTRGGKWARVENDSDRYRGWVRTWGLRSLTPEEARRWASDAGWRVATRYVELRARPGAGATITPLFWNSPLASSGASSRFRKVRLPDGAEGWLAREHLRPRDRRAGSLGRLVRGFWGVPYLWGGRTPLGFDCSGFVQQTLAGMGVYLPRDADQQFHACRILSRPDRAERGDLLFFGRRGKPMTHVAIALGKGLYAHSRGTVRVNSLVPGKQLYDKSLSETLRAAGRTRSQGV